MSNILLKKPIFILYKKTCTSYFLTILLLITTTSYANTQSQISYSTFETTLKNGLKVIIREDHRSPLVLTQIWYKVGSTDESGHLLGISHALEHMMFKGTKEVPNDEFMRLSRIYGGSINAATFTNYTNYYQLYPKTYFPLALELEADRMKNLLLKKEDFDTEIKVVMEERRQRTDDNPRALAFERFKWIAYPTSHYRQPVIGHMKNLQNIQLNDLKTWYKNWYAPNNAILVIVGDINSESAIQQVEKYFGHIRPQQVPPRNDVLEFERVGFRHMELYFPVEVPNLYMSWNVKSLVTAKDPQDAYALTIIKNILDGGISSRLQQKLVRDKKVLSAVNVGYDPYNRGDSLFIISAVPTDKFSLLEIQQAIEAEIKILKETLIDQTEINQVSSNFVSHLIYSQDDLAGQAKMIGNLAINGLNYRLIDKLPTYFEEVTPQDIKRVANKYFVRENLSTLYVLPEEKVKN